MKRTSYVVLGLILVGMAFLYFLQGAEELEEATYTVPSTQLSIDPRRVVRIDITRPDGFVRIERVRGEWKITEPVFAAIDQDRMDALRGGMEDFRLLGLVSVNPRKQKTLHVDEQGTSVMFVNDEGRSLNLVVGKAAPTGGSAFVRSPLSDTVYLAQGLTPSVVNLELADWRVRQVYSAPPESLASLTILSGGRRFDLSRRDGGWASRDRTIPSELIGPAMSALQSIRAESFVDTALVLVNRPAYELEIGGSRPVRLELYALAPLDTNYLLKASSSPSLVLVRPVLAARMGRIIEHLTPAPRPSARPAEAEAKPPDARPEAPRRETAPAQRIEEPVRQVQSPPEVTTQPPVAAPRTPPASPARTRRSTRQAQVAAGVPEDEGDLTVHIVRRGETLVTIGRKYSVAVEKLRKWNGLHSDTVVPGMELYVFVKKR